MQGRGHLLKGRKKSWEINDVPGSRNTLPAQQYPVSTTALPRRPTFASETQSEADIILPRPHQSSIARSLSTPDSSSRPYKQTRNESIRPTSDQFPQSSPSSSLNRTDRQGEARDIYDAQQIGSQIQGRSSYMGNDYAIEEAVTRQDSVSPSQSMSWESKESKASWKPHPENLGGQRRRDDEMGSERSLRPPALSTERYEASQAERTMTSPAGQGMANWNFRDPQYTQASNSQQRPVSQIVSPRTSGYSEEPQRLMTEGQRTRQSSFQQNYQDSNTKDRSYQAQYRGSTSSAYQPMASQRWSTDSYSSEALGPSDAGRRYQAYPEDEVDKGLRELQRHRGYPEDEVDYGLRGLQRTQTDQFYPNSRQTEGRGIQPALRRHTGFEDLVGGRHERDPPKEYASSEDRQSADSASEFEWRVRVRWDDPDSLYASFDQYECTLKFDSGCDNSNWVSEDIARRVKAHIKPLEYSERFIAFNGASMNPIGRTSLAFARLDGGEGGSLPRTVFLVAQGDNIPFDMILGARDSVRFGFLSRPRDPSDGSRVLGLAAAPMTPEQKKKQEERDIAQAIARKGQKEKQKWFLRKKPGDQNQNTTSSRHDRNGEQPRRNTTTQR